MDFIDECLTKSRKPLRIREVQISEQEIRIMRNEEKLKVEKKKELNE